VAIRREPIRIPLYVFIKPLRIDSVKFRQIRVENHLLLANTQDRRLDVDRSLHGLTDLNEPCSESSSARVFVGVRISARSFSGHFKSWKAEIEDGT